MYCDVHTWMSLYMHRHACTYMYVQLPVLNVHCKYRYVLGSQPHFTSNQTLSALQCMRVSAPHWLRSCRVAVSSQQSAPLTDPAADCQNTKAQTATATGLIHCCHAFHPLLMLGVLSHKTIYRVPIWPTLLKCGKMNAQRKWKKRLISKFYKTYHKKYKKN